MKLLAYFRKNEFIKLVRNLKKFRKNIIKEILDFKANEPTEKEKKVFLSLLRKESYNDLLNYKKYFPSIFILVQRI